MVYSYPEYTPKVIFYCIKVGSLYYNVIDNIHWLTPEIRKEIKLFTDKEIAKKYAEDLDFVFWACGRKIEIIELFNRRVPQLMKWVALAARRREDDHLPAVCDRRLDAGV